MTKETITSTPCPICGAEVEVWMGDGDWTTDWYECEACGYKVEVGALETT